MTDNRTQIPFCIRHTPEIISDDGIMVLTQLSKVFGYLRSHPQQGGVHRPLLERHSAAVEWGGSLCTPRGKAVRKHKQLLLCAFDKFSLVSVFKCLFSCNLFLFQS